MVRVVSEKTSTRKNLQLHFDNLPHDIAQVASEHDIYVFVSCFYNEVRNLVSTCFPQIQIQHFFLSGAIWISTINFNVNSLQNMIHVSFHHRKNSIHPFPLFPNKKHRCFGKALALNSYTIPAWVQPNDAFQVPWPILGDVGSRRI